MITIETMPRVTNQTVVETFTVSEFIRGSVMKKGPDVGQSPSISLN